MLYWLPKLHKRPYKARFIANFSSSSTTVLSKLLTSCLTAIKNIGLDTMILFTFLYLHLSVLDGFISCKIYDKHDDFEIVNFLYLDWDVPRRVSYAVYISQLIRFARMSSHVTDFNTRNKLLPAQLLNQGYRYH